MYNRSFDAGYCRRGRTWRTAGQGGRCLTGWADLTVRHTTALCCQVGEALRAAGPGITVTSLTDVLVH